MKNKTKQVVLDDTDLAILALLQADASISNAQLSERLSLSLTPCWRRRKRLEEEGVIKDYQANLDRKMLGLEIMAFVHVRFAIHTDHAPDAFEAVIKELPQVLACHKITGDADYLLQVLAEDLDSYSEFVEGVLRRQLGIASIQSSLALKEVKATSRVAIPTREAAPVERNK
ncbi:MAG: Lrp/AsnC family transcriptional regulator [Pseudomonas sp.]|uniref:Lrp/AsnC family transcriptional regulator n=1 Tax=Pseudomonas sp. TaxID=306 RepID=UPI003C73FFFB